MNQVKLSIELIERYNLPVPRYTSYPTVPYWKTKFSPHDYIKLLRRLNKKQGPLSLYIHLPFCKRRCSFCGCNTFITSKHSLMESYLNSLKQEISSIADLLPDRRVFSQFHLGGGTPTYYPPELLADLLDHVESLFTPESSAEKSIELHPSVTSEEHIDVLISRGFTRLSMGVQDFDPVVQEKIHRYQTFEETESLITYARKKGATSINIDLIYGLPYQTLTGFSKTLDLINELKPNRLAVYSYAHLPRVFKHQSIFPAESIPQGREKLGLFLLAQESLVTNGYEQVGFDHFSLPTDSLYQAYKNGDLQRNFMGYTTRAGTDLLAFGYSGISDFGDAYIQNTKSLPVYFENIAKYGVSPKKGILLSKDDVIRKRAINQWLCKFTISPQEYLESFGLDALPLLRDIRTHFPAYEQEGLVLQNEHGWEATPLGRLFARIPASSMDAYLKLQNKIPTFSKVI